MKILISLLIALGVVTLAVIVSWVVYTWFFGSIYIDIDFRNDHKRRNKPHNK